MDALKVYHCQTREIRVYIGGHIGYSPEPRKAWKSDGLIDEGSMRGMIWKFQGAFGGGTDTWQPPLRMTKTQFLYAGGVEDGWEITGLWYPPKPPELEGQLFEYMEKLAQFLQKEFQQRRVTLVGPSQTWTFENTEVKAR